LTLNIFYLDNSPKSAARMQCDRHVVKMILESAQLLSTAHRVLDGDEWADSHSLYRSTHKNHPSAVWARESALNYKWLYRHFLALCDEYCYRYGKIHLSETKLADALWFTPTSIDHNVQFTCPPQCMPDEFKADNTILAYRQYYALDKAPNDWFCYKKNRSAPLFISEIQNGYGKDDQAVCGGQLSSS
jgi:hypothetical protein